MLEGIYVFLDVTRHGTFSAAAKVQGVAVSSVSRQVDALEKSLGAALFHRSSRRLLLTDAGEQFLPRAQLIVSELEDAKAALLDAQAEPRGMLSVTATAAFGRRHVMPVVASFLKQHPLIELDLHLSNQRVVLSTQRMDVAIRIGVLPDSDLVATQLAPLTRVACASPHYIREHGHPASPQDLLQHSCLTLAGTRVPVGWWSFPDVNHGKALAVKGRFRSDVTRVPAGRGRGRPGRGPPGQLASVRRAGGRPVGAAISCRCHTAAQVSGCHPRGAAQGAFSRRQGPTLYRTPEAGLWCYALLGPCSGQVIYKKLGCSPRRILQLRYCFCSGLLGR